MVVIGNSLWGQTEKDFFATFRAQKIAFLQKKLLMVGEELKITEVEKEQPAFAARQPFSSHRYTLPARELVNRRREPAPIETPG